MTFCTVGCRHSLHFHFLMAGNALAGSIVEQDLLYARDIGAECEIGVWHTRHGRTSELGRIESCPERLFWEPEYDTVFIADENAILAIDLHHPGSIKTVASLPSLRIRDYIERISNKPNEEYLAMKAGS